MWLVAANLAMAEFLERTRQDMDLHTKQVFCPLGPHLPSLKCMDHEHFAMGGAVQRGLRSLPQPSRALHFPALGWLLWPCSCISAFLHCIYRARMNRMGLLHLCWAGRWGALVGLTWLKDAEWPGLKENKLN